MSMSGGATLRPYTRTCTVRKVQTKEPKREPLASIVLMPGVPTSTCPHCLYSKRVGVGTREWPAIERQGGRLLYGCDSGHRWFAADTYDRP